MIKLKLNNSDFYDWKALIGLLSFKTHEWDYSQLELILVKAWSVSNKQKSSDD